MADREVVLLVAEGCPHCKALLEKIKDGVRVLDVTKDPRGAAIIRSLGIYRVPLMVSVEKVDGSYEFCALDENSMKAKCVKVPDLPQGS
jgi:glutaredoxin